MIRLICLVVLITVTYGYIADDEEDAVINGNLAEIEDFPYYAFLSVRGHLLCGGAFVTRDLIVTAAHCIGHPSMKVYPGITRLKDLKRAKSYAVKSAIAHPKFWKTFDFAYDVGLIKLKKKIKLGNRAKTIRLATEAPPIGEEGTIAGFGVVKCVDKSNCRESSRESKQLRYADLVFESVEEDGLLHTRSRDNKNTCYGDSGGPIVYNGTLVGVVSTGEHDDCTGYSVQAPVFARLDWIQETADSM